MSLLFTLLLPASKRQSVWGTATPKRVAPLIYIYIYIYIYIFIYLFMCIYIYIYIYI